MYKLFNHQQEAVEFAIQNNGNCALFHDPGLGKTRTSLEVYKYFKIGDPKLKLLVVCPLSLINSAWGEEITNITNFSYSEFKKVKRNIPDIIIINYEALISKKSLPVIHQLIMNHNFMCILDESSRLKNHKSLTTKALLFLSDFFKHRIIASGTPMPNIELELWGQVKFIHSDIFPKSFYAFRNIYFHLQRNGQIMQGSFMSKQAMRDVLSKGWKYTISEIKRRKLMLTIKPFTHWVKKEDALDLPEKIDQIREVNLNAHEKKAYKEMEKDLITEIKGKQISVQVALAKIMKLRQAVSGFFYSNEEIVEISRPSKLKELEIVLEELGNRQVIIWGHFVHEIKVIEKELQNKYGISSIVTLYSKTDDREESIRKFKQGEARFLIANPQSAGHGLTFTNCCTQVFYSLSYSYEQYAQARDRTHRISQKNKCLYVHLIAKDTIDEQMLEVVRGKKTLQDMVYQIVKEKKNV